MSNVQAEAASRSLNRTRRRVRTRRRRGHWPNNRVGPRRLAAEREIDMLIRAENKRYRDEIRQLRAEAETLRTERHELRTERKHLRHKVDLYKTLWLRRVTQSSK